MEELSNLFLKTWIQAMTELLNPFQFFDTMQSKLHKTTSADTVKVLSSTETEFRTRKRPGRRRKHWTDLKKMRRTKHSSKSSSSSKSNQTSTSSTRKKSCTRKKKCRKKMKRRHRIKKRCRKKCWERKYYKPCPSDDSTITIFHLDSIQ